VYTADAKQPGLAQGGAALILTGLAAGFASSFLGIGGGLVMVPALTLGAAMPFRRAVGTSLAAIVPVAACGVLVESFVQASNIRWGCAVLLMAGSLAGAAAGARLESRSKPAMLRRLMAVVLVAAAVRLSGVTGGGVSAGVLPDPLAGAGIPATFAIGLCGGITSSLFGIGGGLITVPGMTFLFSGLPFHAARATSLAVIVPTAIAAALLAHGKGLVDVAAAKSLVVPALFGSVAGVLAANRLPEMPLRITFCVYLLYAAVKLLLPPGAPREEAPA